MSPCGTEGGVKRPAGGKVETPDGTKAEETLERLLRSRNSTISVRTAAGDEHTWDRTAAHGA